MRVAEELRLSHTLLLVVVVRIRRITTTRRSYLRRPCLPKPHLKRDMCVSTRRCRNSRSAYRHLLLDRRVDRQQPSADPAGDRGTVACIANLKPCTIGGLR